MSDKQTELVSAIETLLKECTSETRRDIVRNMLDGRRGYTHETFKNELLVALLGRKSIKDMVALLRGSILTPTDVMRLNKASIELLYDGYKVADTYRQGSVHALRMNMPLKTSINQLKKLIYTSTKG